MSQYTDPRYIAMFLKIVFWLVVRPTPFSFPSVETVDIEGLVPTYSGGPARELHPVPLFPIYECRRKLAKLRFLVKTSFKQKSTS